MLRCIFFKFDVSLLKKSSIPIVDVPRNHLIYSITPIVVEEAFNGSNVFLQIGIINNSDSVVEMPVNNVLNNIILPTYATYKKDFGRVINIPIQLYTSLRIAGEPPDRGSGYGIITLLDLGKVEGY